jgi:hypothetical protein
MSAVQMAGGYSVVYSRSHRISGGPDGESESAWLGPSHPITAQTVQPFKPFKPVKPLTPLTPLVPQFWTAAFPGLARDLPEVKESEEKLARHEVEWVHAVPIHFLYFIRISVPAQQSQSYLRVGSRSLRRSQKSHDRLDMLTRNRLANVSFFVCSIGELVVLAILAGILEGIITDDPDSNTRALSIVCAYSAGVWSESDRSEVCDVVSLHLPDHRTLLIGLIPVNLCLIARSA